jgi:hypothetical protein
MQIARENGDEVGSVWALCTREEAEHLFTSLAYYFEEDPPDPGWHCHVGNGDQVLTIAITEA